MVNRRPLANLAGEVEFSFWVNHADCPFGARAPSDDAF